MPKYRERKLVNAVQFTQTMMHGGPECWPEGVNPHPWRNTPTPSVELLPDIIRKIAVGDWIVEVSGGIICLSNDKFKERYELVSNIEAKL